MQNITLYNILKLTLCFLSFGFSTQSFAQNQIFDGIDFVQITGADYQFGSPDNQEGNTYFEKQYNLLMPHTFWMSKYEITQAQWEAVMGYNPSTHKALGPVATQPVETVSWNDVQLFVDRLNTQAGGEYYRLPTEAEWEFVAKANTNTRWSFGDSANQLGAYTYTDGSPLPRSIGGRQANPYGIHDLYGNVYEWVEDWYVLDRDPDFAACPPESGAFKVLRGGSNSSILRFTRSTSRNFAHPDRRSWQVGFRLVRVANPADDFFRSGERCKRGVPGVDFFVDSMTTACSAYDHNGITGDDRGGIAYGYDHVYYTGDTRTVKASTTLGNPTGITQRDGLLSNLASEEIYHLGMNGSLVAGRNVNFNQLIKLDANLNPTHEILNLSKTVTTKDTNGIFSGYGEVLFFFNDTYHAVNFVTGEVESFPGTITALNGCENWAAWGFAERIDGIRYVTYRRSGNQTVVRYDIETGDIFTIASFNDVNDMCSITVSPSAQKWFFHYEGSAQLGNGSEVIGSCNANIQVRVDPKICGNGDLNLGEFCDDGNRSSLDGCTADCKVAVCGDGFLRGNSNEECDDGNNVNGDGCDANCLIEQCGSGRVEGNEACDDGNNSNLDECTNACVVATCGDGFLRANSAEECDDSNNNHGDGCDANCLIEQCGNGRLEGNEACDDGNNNNEDDCDNNCQVVVNSTTWHQGSAGPQMRISENGLFLTSANTSHSWNSAYSTDGVSAAGKHIWEIEIARGGNSSANFWEAIIGVANNRSRGTSYFTANGYGYIMEIGKLAVNSGQSVAYGQEYRTASRVRVELNLRNGALVFVRNGVSQGLATNVPLGQTYYLVASIGDNQTAFRLVSYRFEP